MQKKIAKLARCTCKFYNNIFLDKWVILWLIKDSGSTQKNLNEADMLMKKLYAVNNVLLTNTNERLHTLQIRGTPWEENVFVE